MSATPARLLAREILAEARTRDAYVRDLVAARRREYFADGTSRRSPSASGRINPDTSGRINPDTSGRINPDTSGRINPDTSGRIPSGPAPAPDSSGRINPDTSGRIPSGPAPAPGASGGMPAAPAPSPDISGYVNPDTSGRIPSGPAPAPGASGGMPPAPPAAAPPAGDSPRPAGPEPPASARHGRAPSRPKSAVTSISREDFDFAQVLVFGVTMCSGTLDEAINRCLNSPRDVRPRLRDALRVSAYELLFLGKPAHVAVNQGVDLARSVEPRAAGLANAALRRLAAEAPTFPWGNPLSDDAALARCHGVPEWLASRLADQLGRTRASGVLAACLEPAPTYLAANPFAPANPFASDLAAQQVAALVPLTGEILEIGAGRGTKTMLLESRAQRELGHTVGMHTVDTHEWKSGILERRLSAYGLDAAGGGPVTVHTGDARDLDAVAGLPGAFDAVLVDAPCSGTGTLRRHPEIRWRLEPEDVTSLSRLQLELLAAAASRCRPGGTVVYSTCSILAEENEDVIERFMTSPVGEDFAVDPVRPDELLGTAAAMAAHIPGTSGGWGLDEQSITSWGCFASVPEVGGPDGHFAARLHRLC